MQYIDDLPTFNPDDFPTFNPKEICNIHPNVFFTPVINFLASRDAEVLAFYNGLSFSDMSFAPAKSRLYYFMHPVNAVREMKSSADPDMWRRYILGRLSGMYPVLISAAKALKHKLAAVKSRCVYYWHAGHIDRAYDLAGTYSVISFDVFDTLVFRKCTGYQVFDLAAEKYNAVHADKIESFREHRIKAQNRAQRKSFSQEISLGEIYDELADEYSDVFAEDMKNAEIEAELEAVYPNAEMQNFYNTMKATGKRIIIASDMYLPGKVIAALLKKCGYDGYETLYVSSECRVRKSSGALFRKIVRDKGVLPSEILHIGDNLHSDYRMAASQGLIGFLYKK